MQRLWDGDRVSPAFDEAFRAWAARHDGDVDRLGEAALAAEFEPSGPRASIRLSLYRAGGRKRLRFDTVREEIELTGLTKFEITDDTLTLETDKGSRTFVLELAGRHWDATKQPV